LPHFITLDYVLCSASIIIAAITLNALVGKADVILKSTITCPQCGHQATEQMPTDACQFFYNCKGCGERLKPKEGDCCVFCSYGSVPCPPIQVAGAGGAGTACCPRTAEAADWLANTRTNALAWWLPQLAVIGALLAPMSARVGVWTVSLAWMGTACILNSRRCGRTHCRYTGPYYLAMIVPVIVFGVASASIPFAGWVALAAVILLGSKGIWWATERAWGKFSPR
jgi:hypothetical protein